LGLPDKGTEFLKRRGPIEVSRRGSWKRNSVRVVIGIGVVGWGFVQERGVQYSQGKNKWFHSKQQAAFRISARID